MRPRRITRASSTPARCTPRSVRAGPGACPICGMALEPRPGQPATRTNPELVDMTRRFWVARRAHRCRCFALAMSDHPGSRARAPDLCPASSSGSSSCWRRRWCCGAGWPFFVRGVAVRRRPQPQHVHADRRSASASPTATASLRRSRPGSSPRRSAAHGGEVAGLLRGGRRHRRRWSCSARCWSCARAAGRARAIRALLGLAPKTARRRPRRRQRGRRPARAACRPATGCACARARRSRSTASSSKARARSTSR